MSVLQTHKTASALSDEYRSLFWHLLKEDRAHGKLVKTSAAALRLIVLLLTRFVLSRNLGHRGQSCGA